MGLLVGGPASAEPISVELHTSSGGFDAGSDSWTASGFELDLGTLEMPAGSVGTFFIDGLNRRADYSVTFDVTGMNGWDTLTAEVLDPVDRDDATDATQPAYVPGGYSTSNTVDGFSFAQNSGMTRSAEFVGGSASVFADEDTDARDMLTFNGLGGSAAQVNFGLRDYHGERGFLLRLSASGLNDMSAVPEPTSMLLIGTGLAGLAFRYRRRLR
jgi:hypothetical protein